MIHWTGAIQRDFRATCCLSCGRFRSFQTPNKMLMRVSVPARVASHLDRRARTSEGSRSEWYGYSVGKWEDDYTFVVETVGTDERTWLDNAGDPHSSEMRVEERYHRLNHDTVELTVKIDDPKIYTEPWLARDKLRSHS